MFNWCICFFGVVDRVPFGGAINGFMKFIL